MYQYDPICTNQSSTANAGVLFVTIVVKHYEVRIVALHPLYLRWGTTGSPLSDPRLTRAWRTSRFCHSFQRSSSLSHLRTSAKWFNLNCRDANTRCDTVASVWLQAPDFQPWQEMILPRAAGFIRPECTEISYLSTGSTGHITDELPQEGWLVQSWFSHLSIFEQFQPCHFFLQASDNI